MDTQSKLYVHGTFSLGCVSVGNWTNKPAFTCLKSTMEIAKSVESKVYSKLTVKIPERHN